MTFRSFRYFAKKYNLSGKDGNTDPTEIPRSTEVETEEVLVEN